MVRQALKMKSDRCVRPIGSKQKLQDKCQATARKVLMGNPEQTALAHAPRRKPILQKFIKTPPLNTLLRSPLQHFKQEIRGTVLTSQVYSRLPAMIHQVQSSISSDERSCCIEAATNNATHQRSRMHVVVCIEADLSTTASHQRNIAKTSLRMYSEWTNAIEVQLSASSGV